MASLRDSAVEILASVCDSGAMAFRLLLESDVTVLPSVCDAGWPAAAVIKYETEFFGSLLVSRWKHSVLWRWGGSVPFLIGPENFV
jgi:hypothetical protein